MNHFILTRFNVRLYPKDKKGNKTLTPEWLEHRFQLFERYTQPSLSAQTCKDFKWIVLIDRETPQEYKDRLEGCVEQCPNLHIIRVRSDKGYLSTQVFREVIQRDMKALYGDDYKDGKVLTTWMDNDDALAIDFVERVQQEASKLSVKRPTFIAFHYGLQYFTQKEVAVRHRFKNNHFISLLEVIQPNELPKTVFGYGNHWYVYSFDKQCDIHQVANKDKAAWIEVVHNRNVANDILPRMFWYRPISDIHLLEKEFGLDVTLDKHNARRFYTTILPKIIKVNAHHFVTRAMEKMGLKPSGKR
ncbi:MAG: hypothetical protein IKX33_06630 [Prevotella sp.]|nr:hypothetical protein [Prevotella sp.]